MGFSSINRAYFLVCLLALPVVGQIDMQTHGTATQSSNWNAQNSFPASFGLDGNTGNFTHTADAVDSWWQVVLDQAFMIERVEVVNRANCCAARLGGLTLRVFDGSDQVVHETVMTNPGLGASFHAIFPSLLEVKRVWIGLENGDKNDDNRYIVTIAELRLYEEFIPPPPPAGPNWALNQPSYMVRLQDSLPPAAHANDGDYITATQTTIATVDGYWEVDLGQLVAVDHVRAFAASCCSDKVGYATLRLFDTRHDSVFSMPMPVGMLGQYDMILSEPVCARYVRIGLENKVRTNPRWQIGFAEVEVYGRPPEQVGFLDFSASATDVSPGQAVDLAWAIERIDEVWIFPDVGNIDAQTDTNGLGVVTVNPLVSTEYLMVATNGCGLNTTSVLVKVNGLNLPVRINEFVAVNRLSLKDGYGDPSDWIELYNPNDFEVDLTGYGLSDQLDQPLKWVFPPASIPAFGTLVVYASGRDDPLDPVAGYHTPWKLDGDGESIRLSTPDGLGVMDEIPNYPGQMEDLAYGRDLSGTLRFLEPSPGAVNFTDSYAGWLETLSISHPRGFYTDPILVSLGNPNPNTNVQVFVSLDGDVPDTLYTVPISISGTSVIRADVRRADYKSPRSLTHSYLYIDDTIASGVMNTGITQDVQYTIPLREGMTNLPSFCVSIPDDPSRSEQGGSVEILWPATGEALQSDCGFAIFGGAYTTFAKTNFRLLFRSEYGTPKLKAPLFNGFEHGFPDDGIFDTLDLRAGSHDMVSRGFYMSNRYADDSMLDMGSLNPHGRFVHLYLNGVYWGQYHLRERMVDHFLADHLGGAPSDYFTIRGNDNVGQTFVPGTPDPLYRDRWDRIRDNGNNYQFVKDYLDVQSLIDFMLIWLYGNCEAEYRSASSAEAGSGAKFWVADADGLLRVPGNRSNNAGPGGLFGALTGEADPDFMTLLADRVYKHLFNDGALTPVAARARLDLRMDEIQHSLIAECARWGYRT
ncbi:MAG: CotH kinase family protein, partial [Verrucomicrobiota bacterium]